MSAQTDTPAGAPRQHVRPPRDRLLEWQASLVRFLSFIRPLTLEQLKPLGRAQKKDRQAGNAAAAAGVDDGEGDGVEVVEEWIESREPGRKIKAFVFVPEKARSQGVGLPPVVLNWHASGFLIPSHGVDHPFCFQLARTLGAVVIDADYRKAPEDPWPLPLEDAVDAVRWLSRQSSRFDLSRVALSGFSAGGYMALAMSHLEPSLQARAVVSTYPATDLSGDAAPHRIAPDAKSRPLAGAALAPWLLRLFTRAFLERVSDPTPGEGAYSHVLKLESLPATSFAPHLLVSSGECDSLHPEAQRLCEVLRSKGHADATFEGQEKVGHAWVQEAHRSEEVRRLRDEYYARCAAFVARAWE